MQVSPLNTLPDLPVPEISRYLELGWPVFPCAPGEKRPACENGFHDATLDAFTLLKWYAKPGKYNVGIPTGKTSGGWVLDIDPGKGGTESFAKLTEGIELPPTPIARTGRGGLHYWFAMPHGPVNNAVGIMPGIDIRGDGGYVVVPPSTLPEGPYEWLTAPWDADLAPAPAELLERLERAHKQQRKPEGAPSSSTAGRGFNVESALQGVPEGQRDETLFKLASRLRTDNVGMDSAIAMLEIAARNCTPPFDPRLARAKVEWVWQNYPAGRSDDATRRVQHALGNELQVTSEDAKRASAVVTFRDDTAESEVSFNYARTDLGNAERLAARLKGKAVWCPIWKSWLFWDGRRWQMDDLCGVPVQEMAIETVRGIVDEGRDPETLKWATRSQERKQINAMTELVKALPGMSVAPSVFDTDDWLLNLPNGTLDLRTGELRTHRREDMITRLGGAPYDPDPNVDLWADFLNTVTSGSEDLQEFLCRSAGYSLTGSTREQCLFFLFGTGRNGKSTFMDLLMHALGDYAIHTPTETLMMKRDAGVPNDLARLKGARLVAATETESGRRLAESLVKQLTGGDPITARYLHAEFFTFTPTFKLWMSGNYKPSIQGSDEGIWRRMRLVPFDVRIPDDQIDPDLPEKLKERAESILAWMVSGCLDWQRSGLPKARLVESATNQYRSDMDTIGQFIEECVEADERSFLLSGNLYGAYRRWCEQHGEFPRSQKSLSQEMASRDYRSSQVPGGKRGFKGLRLSDEGARLLESGGAR